MKEVNTKYMETKVNCACGNNFTVNSNKPELHIEVCNQCHPAYTGVQNTTTKSGRVEKFNRKYGFDNKEGK